MGIGYNPRIVTENLVFCVDAANVRSYPGTGTTWTDLKGGNNGTLTNMGAANFSGDNGGGLNFDGSDEYIHGGDTASLITNACCISAWFKSDGVDSRNDSFGGVLFAQSSTEKPGIWLSYSWLNQNINFGVRASSVVTSASSSVLRNTFYYVVGQQDGSEQKIFINGELSASRLYSQAPQVTSPAYQIGRWGYGGYNRFFNGLIYNVALYNRALTDDEIRQNYLATKERYA